MNTLIATFILSIIMTTSASNNSELKNGLVTVKSNHSAADTANRFADLVTKKGLTLFSRIDHSKNAKQVDLNLNHSEVILFGNPKVGTKLMQCAPTIAIDLPQKALIWQDQNRAVFISYNDPQFLKQQHSIEGCDEILSKVSGLLEALAQAAAE